MRVIINPTTGEVSFDVDTVDDAIKLARSVYVEPEATKAEVSSCEASATAELTGAQYDAWAFLVANENTPNGVHLSAVARHLKVNNSAAGQRMMKLVELGYALIQAAMRKADTPNLEALKAAFPETWAELQVRYNSPGGLLPSERPTEFCPGEDDPRCKGICTVHAVTGRIMDPDCFR